MREQGPLPGRPDTRDFIERVHAHGLAALGPVCPDHETVSLVPQPLNEVEHGVPRLEHHRSVTIGKMKVLPARIAVGPLGDPHHGNVREPEFLQDGHGHGKLAETAVDEDEIRPVREFLGLRRVLHVFGINCVVTRVAFDQDRLVFRRRLVDAFVGPQHAEGERTAAAPVDRWRFRRHDPRRRRAPFGVGLFEPFVGGRRLRLGLAVRDLFFQALETTRQHLAHHGVVVAGRKVRRPDVELTVLALHEAVGPRHDHGAHGMRALNVAVIVDLDAPRCLRQVEALLEPVEQRLDLVRACLLYTSRCV